MSFKDAHGLALRRTQVAARAGKLDFLFAHATVGFMYIIDALKLNIYLVLSTVLT